MSPYGPACNGLEPGMSPGVSPNGPACGGLEPGMSPLARRAMGSNPE
jgi:hypothetical protein